MNTRIFFKSTILFLTAHFAMSQHVFANPITGDKQIVVIIPSYNNMQWYEKNLDSLINQEYTNWRAIYIDDCSTDGTGNAVASYIANHHLEDRILLIKNSQRQFGMYNLYQAIHIC